MENERGYWVTVSPLPDCPAGTKGESVGNDYWNFHYPDGKDCITYHEAAIRRNRAIFRWVTEAEKSTFHCHQCGKDFEFDGEISHSCCEKVLLSYRAYTPQPEPERAENKRKCRKCGQQIMQNYIHFEQGGDEHFPDCPVPERVEWPEPYMVCDQSPGGRDCYDANYSVYVWCKDVAVANKTADLIGVVLQALREGRSIFASTDHDTMKCLMRPDGSRP